MLNKRHEIGAVISKLRKEKGWTQNELAEKLQVSDKAISKWESNKGSPSIEFLPMLAELFDVTLDYLMTGKKTEEKIITMSKIELCAKKDDPSLLDNLLFISAKIRDENGLTLMDYVMKYNSLNILKTLVDSCSCQTDYQNWFPKLKFDFPEMLALMKIDRERVVLKNITNSTEDVIRLQFDNLTSDSIWKDEKNKKEISEGYKSIIKYLIENYDNLTYGQKSYYFDIDGEKGLLKKNCWSFAYPYFIDIAADCNKNLLEKLITRIEAGNKYYKSELAELKKKMPGYESFSCVERDMANNIKNNYALICPFESTVLKLLENGEFELAERLNKHLKNSISCDKFEHAKIMKDKNISEFEKQKLLCVHEGILNIDEALKLNDFKIIKQMLEEYPISYYEMLSNWLENKSYKEIYQFAIDNSLREIAADIKNGKYNDLERKIKNVKIEKYEKDNYKYIETKQGVINNKEQKPYEGLYSFTGVMANVKSNILYNFSLKIDKNKITEGLNREFFVNQFDKENYDIVIIKLCVKLEAILKCDYYYTGTFEEMLNKFCSQFNMYDDYGNDYDPYTPALLNKLRKKRNNIVHSEINNVELSQKEIKDCIDYICKLDKEN